LEKIIWSPTKGGVLEGFWSGIVCKRGKNEEIKKKYYEGREEKLLKRKKKLYEKTSRGGRCKSQQRIGRKKM